MPRVLISVKSLKTRLSCAKLGRIFDRIREPLDDACSEPLMGEGSGMSAEQPQSDAQSKSQVSVGPRQLVSGRALCTAFGVSASWIYKHSRKGGRDALPVVRLGRSLRFDAEQIALYLASRERHRPDATLDSSDGIARVSRKGKYRLTRNDFRPAVSGCVRIGVQHTGKVSIGRISSTRREEQCANASLSTSAR